MSNDVRANWMLDQIKTIKAQHTVGTGEAFHILKIRDTYESLRTRDVTLNEVMVLCEWLKEAAHYLLMRLFFQLMNAEDQPIKIDDLAESCRDIFQHHENSLGPREYKAYAMWESQKNEVYQITCPKECSNRLPRIKYEVFKAHWSMIKTRASDPKERLENLIQILLEIPNWLTLPGSGDAIADTKTALKDYFLTFAMDPSETEMEIEMLSDTVDDEVIHNYAHYYQYHRKGNELYLQDSLEWLEGRSLTGHPKWEEEQFHAYDRLIERFSNELVLHRLEARREIAIAYVEGRGTCNEQLLKSLQNELQASIKRYNVEIQNALRSNHPSALIEDLKKSLLRCQYLIPCLLENRTFLLKYFRS